MASAPPNCRPSCVEQAQLGEKFLLGQGKLFADARVLQRGDAESARLEDRAEPVRDGHAERAISIEENPSGARLAAFAVCHF